MKTLSASLALALAVMTPAAGATAGDTLLVERVQNEAAFTLPARGSSMTQVQSKFGIPAQKLAPISGPNSRKYNPPITRWVYGNFTVYFEHDKVITSVVNRLTALEQGPKPPEG